MSSELDRYLDDFGDRLARSAASARPRPAARLALGGTVVAVVPLVAVLLVTLSSSPAGGRLDVIAEARAALAPPGQIVYLKITARTTGVNLRISRQARGPVVTEQWTTVDPPRWRLVQTLPGRFRGTQHQEISYANGTQSSYNVRRDLVEEQQGFSDAGPAAKPLGPLGGDPQHDLPALLASGRLRDAGLVQAGGRSVRRLISRQPSRVGSITLTYDVDPESFAPLGGFLVSRIYSRNHQQAYESRTTFTVDRYQRVPLTADTERLLVIKTTASTKVKITTKAERERNERRQAAGCHINRSGVRVCPVRRPKADQG